jgi:drug/metabolite transporter (DMT)-like permease
MGEGPTTALAAPAVPTDGAAASAGARWPRRTATAIAAARASAALPTLVMLAVAIVWGASFSVVDATTATVAPAELVFWRFGLAAVALTVVTHRAPRLPGHLLRRAVALGALLGTGFLVQTWALTDTDAMTSGFLIGTLVVMAPLFAWVMFRVRPSAVTLAAAGVATAGLAVMSLRGGGFGRGEAATVLAAALWALHLVLLARWGRPGFALGLAAVQAATVAALALLGTALTAIAAGRSPLPGVPQDANTWLQVGFLALPATAVAMVAVSWAQPRMTAARAAVALTLEPAAAAVTATLLGATPDVRVVLGGTLLVGATLLVELGPRIRTRRPPVVVNAAR